MKKLTLIIVLTLFILNIFSQQQHAFDMTIGINPIIGHEDGGAMLSVDAGFSFPTNFYFGMSYCSGGLFKLKGPNYDGWNRFNETKKTGIYYDAFNVDIGFVRGHSVFTGVLGAVVSTYYNNCFDKSNSK